MKKKLHIFHIAAEMAPLIKVGGMGDVTQGLCFELAKKGHQVDVFLPKYKSISKDLLSNFTLETPCLISTEKNIRYKNKVYVWKQKNIKIHLIDPIHPKKYFFRNNIYGYPDDIARFLYFSNAVFSYIENLETQPDIVHIHDWHTAILAPLYEQIKVPKKAKVVLTIHNLSYQGSCRSSFLKNVNLDPQKYMKLSKLKSDDPKKKDTCNLLKGAIVYADAINVVSPNYAKEIKIKKYACGMLNTIKKHKDKIGGILNGIDNDFFDPKKDTNLIKNYSQKNRVTTIIQRKTQNKTFLQKQFKLNKKNTFLVISIGRLVFQKGPSLIKSAIFHTLKKGGQFILLGSSHDKKIMAEFKKTRAHFKNNADVHLHFEYDENLSHQIYAAADFIIIPSRFEPCGLTQMIAMTYGTIPIVRKTGGLADTVFDIDDPQIIKPRKNGYTFIAYNKWDMTKALDRAFLCFLENTNTLHSLVKKNMVIDNSWKKSVGEYIKLYKNLHSSL